MAYKEVSVKQPLLLTILPYVSIIIFFAFWEGVVRSGIIPNTLLASPSQVFAAFIDKLSNPNPDGAIMATHAWTSIQEAFIGYLRTYPSHPPHRVDSAYRFLVRHRPRR